MYNAKIGASERTPNPEWAGYGFSKTQLSLFPQSTTSTSSLSPPGLEIGDENKTQAIKHHPALQTHQSNLSDFAAKTDTSKAQDLSSLFIQNSLEKYIGKHSDSLFRKVS